MTPIEQNSVMLDDDIAHELANILAEDETSELNMAIDEEWTLVIDIIRFNSNNDKRILIDNGLWEATYSA